jgi:four helix bundle protein
MIRSHKDRIVWQKAVTLVTLVYKFTNNFPSNERYGLVSQMCKAATSIPSNIAEGRGRGTRKDFCNFLRVAFASGTELETQIIIAQRIGIGDFKESQKIMQLLTEVLKMLNVMILKLGKPKARS